MDEGNRRNESLSTGQKWALAVVVIIIALAIVVLGSMYFGGPQCFAGRSC